MSIAYLNGSYQDLQELRISPLDRGFLFADGIYEVVPVYRGSAFHLEGHIQRLKAGLEALEIKAEANWSELFTSMIQQNGGGDLMVYLQVTRGSAAIRDHRYPEEAQATIFMMARPLPSPSEEILKKGLNVVTQPDIRWQNCHIKTIALLPNVMARQAGAKLGADETLLIRDGIVTEGSTSNVFMVKNGGIHTPIKDRRILPGISREVVLDLCHTHQLEVVERNIAMAEVWQADELWFTSSTKEVLPVTTLDGRAVGNGKPGPLWQRVYDYFQAHKRELCPPD